MRWSGPSGTGPPDIFAHAALRLLVLGFGPTNRGSRGGHQMRDTPRGHARGGGTKNKEETDNDDGDDDEIFLRRSFSDS